MSKSIASYPEAMRRTVVERRLKQHAGGNGYLAALAAADKLGINPERFASKRRVFAPDEQPERPPKKKRNGKMHPHKNLAFKEQLQLA